MKLTNNRYLKLNFAHLLILFLAALLMASGPFLVGAQEESTTPDESEGKKAVEIKIGDEGVTVRTVPDKGKAKISKKIVIDEEGIVLDDSVVDAKHLADSVMQCIAEGGSIVKFGEDITIAENECVDGDLVVIGGDITVYGLVTGDVAVIGGNLYLKSTGIIKGDVQTLGGKLHQEAGSEIRGQRVGLGPVVPIYIRPRFPLFSWTHPFRSFLSFGLPLMMFIVFSLLFVALVAYFAPKNIDRIQHAIAVAPLKSTFLGFLAIILFMPLFLLLCITIIGIPVALILQPIAYFVASIMGFAGVSLFVGSKLHQSSGLNLPTPLAKIVVGAVAIELAFILAWIFTLGGRFSAPFFWMFQLIGWIIVSVAGMAGLGATVWTRFGRRPVNLAPATVRQPSSAVPPEIAGGEQPPPEEPTPG